jgi:hypothetical protein
VNDQQRRERFTRLLDDIVDGLDVPNSKYEEAEHHYNAVGNWLNTLGSKLTPYKPKIYGQGSFAIGTALKPLYDNDYDVDAVVQLEPIPGQPLTQPEVKNLVGDRLKENKTYADMLDPKEGGRRCWTLKYADASKFHLDLIPAVPDTPAAIASLISRLRVPEAIARKSLRITDRHTWDQGSDWPKSNPSGYVDWFRSRMRVVFEKRRMLSNTVKCEVQDLPVYRIRLPLQRAVQLLKRHRDLRYHGNDDKPISIIITTLAAMAYENEEDLGEALLNIVPKMRKILLELRRQDGEWWVPNPTNPAENFADKWKLEPQKQQIFFEWLDAVEREHQALATAVSDRATSIKSVAELLAMTYGRDQTIQVVEKYARGTDAGGLVVWTPSPLARFSVPHRKPLEYPAVQSNYTVDVSGQYFQTGFRDRPFRSGQPLPKGVALTFEAETNVPRPYKVRWQVVNTGAEAHRAKQLRGGFYNGDFSRDGLIRHEKTRYSGTHWVECVIVKNGATIAKSGEFEVKIE